MPITGNSPWCCPVVGAVNSKRKNLAAICRSPRSRSAPRSPVHHPPRSQGIERYSPACYDRARVGRPVGSWFACDQCHLGPSHGVCAIDRRIESDGGNPLMHDPGVLAGGNIGRFRQATGKQVLPRPQIRLFDPCLYSRPGRLGQFELHRTLGFSLQDHRTGQYLIAMRHVPNMQIHQITATQLAVGRQVEHGQVTNLVFVLEVDSDGPDVFRLEWRPFGRPVCLYFRVPKFDGFPCQTPLFLMGV